jgi:nucleoside-diphosphate-sugar epimerase
VRAQAGKTGAEVRVILIGGSGFIGTVLADRLLAAGHEVTIVDKAESSRHPRHWVRADVRDPESLMEACQGGDVLYNLAAEHRDDVRPLSLYQEVNVEGAGHVCRAAASLGIEHLVFTSSVAVYGFTEGEADERAPTRPFNEYGRTKLEAEAVYEAWQAASPRRTLVTVRPTVVFGPGNRGNVYNLLRQVVRTGPVVIGSGRNRKSMAHVENVAAFLEWCLRLPPGRHLFNYADKPDLEMRELVSMVHARLGGSGSVRRLPYAAALGLGAAAEVVSRLTGRSLPLSRVRVRKFAANTQFSAGRALTAGFAPPISLKDALARTVEAEFTQP